MAVQNTDYDQGSYGPPADDPMTFDEAIEQDTDRGRALLALVMLIFVAFASVIWIAYQKGVRADGEPAIITADSRALTVPPSAASQPQTDGAGPLLNSVIEGEQPRVDDVLTTEPPVDVIASMRPRAEDPMLENEQPGGTAALTGGSDGSETGDVIAQVISEAAEQNDGQTDGQGGPIVDQAEQAASAGLEAAGDALASSGQAAGQAAEETVLAVIPTPPTGPGAEGEDSRESQEASEEPQQTANAVPTPPAAVPATSKSARDGAFMLQLASFRSVEEPTNLWDRVRSRHAEVVAGLKPDTEVAQIPGKGTYYRLLIGPFPDRASANATCAALKARKQDCLLRAN